MKINIVLPELGEGINSAVIADWNYQEGEAVTDECDLVEVVTDKAVFNVPSTHNGQLLKICTPQGSEVNIGDIIAIIETSEE